MKHDLRTSIANASVSEPRGDAANRKSFLPDSWTNLIDQETRRIQNMSRIGLHVDPRRRRIITAEFGPPLPEDVVATL